MPLFEVLGDEPVFGPRRGDRARGPEVEGGARALVWTELVDGAPAFSRIVAQLDVESAAADQWTPDGRFLIVPAKSGVALGIVLARYEPNGDWPLHTRAFPAADASFPGNLQVSADSRWLVGGGADGGLYRVALEGDEPGDPERIDTGLGARRFAIASDATRIAFAGGRDAEAGVYLFDDASEVVRIDRDELPQLNFELALAPNEEALVFQAGTFLVPGRPTFVALPQC